MPKIARNLLAWSEQYRRYDLYEDGNLVLAGVADDDQAWLGWLEANQACAFQGRAARVNLLKEARSKSAGYWYAYRRQGRRTIKRYLGATASLKLARLEATANAMTAQAPAETAGASVGYVSGESPPRQRSHATGRERPDLADVPQTTARPTRREGERPDLADVPQATTRYSRQGRQARSADSWAEHGRMEAPLLAPKLQPPRLHGALLRRERLLARLDAGLDSKLILVAAPAGSGKTTLVRQWIAERATAAAPAAWVALDATDNDPVRFWRYCISACRTFGAGDPRADAGMAAALDLLQSAETPGALEALLAPAPLNRALTLLINALAAAGDPLVGAGILVLEDYHAISAPAIQESLAFLIDHLPAALRIVIITRSTPPLPLARWRVANDLVLIEAADLRFSPAETAAMLRQAGIPPLSSAALRQIDADLAGWAAGLRLLALSLRNGAEQQIERLLIDFTGSHRPLQEYLAAEVLDTQPEPVQRFLLQTSVLKRLNGSLCDTVTGRGDSAAMLERLAGAGLFLERIDDGGEWYRYHALFADAMQIEARRRGDLLPDGALTAASLKACDWYEERGWLAEAVEAALQANAPERAADLILRIVGDQDGQPDIHEYHTMRRWLEQLPEALLAANPHLCLTHAITLLFMFIRDRLTPETAARIDRSLHLAETGFRAGGDTARLGEVFAFRALLARGEGLIVQALVWAKQALAWLPADELPWRGVSLTVLAIGELQTGRLSEALRLMVEAQALYATIGERPFIRANMGMLGAIFFESGALHEAADCYRRMLAEARLEDDRDDIGRALIGLAQLAYEWNDLEEAAALAAEGCEVGRLLGDDEYRAYATLVLANVDQASGRAAQAQERVAALLREIEPTTVITRRMLRLLTVNGARLSLGGAHPESPDHAARWMKTLDQRPTDLQRAQRDSEDLMRARLMSAAGQPRAALDLAGPVAARAAESGRGRMALEAQAVAALALAADGQTDRARERLAAALAVAQPEGVMRLFLDEGAPMAALLRSCLATLRSRPQRAYLQRLIQVIDAADPAGPAAETLSAQERRVLALLAEGRTNPAIAAALIVSVNTVKAHVKNIYRKLGAANRLEAGAAARQYLANHPDDYPAG